MLPPLWFSAGAQAQQQHGGGGGVSKKAGRPRGQHSQRAEQAWQAIVNHMHHGSLPSCSTHQNTYKLGCSAGEQPSKHCAYVSVRAANTSATALSCRVCSSRGSKPERVLYDVADAEELVELYAVEACSLPGMGRVDVGGGVVVCPGRKRWDLAMVAPDGLLVEVMGQGHSSRLVTKPNSTDDSMGTRQRKDYAYAHAAVGRGWSVLWLWVEEDDPSLTRSAERWAAQLKQALMYVIGGGEPMLINT